MTTIVIDTPKLLPIRINTLTPGDTKNNFVYTYTASVDITAQLHSGTQGFTAGQYDGRDVRVGDYIATSSQGRILKISSITNAGPTRIECTLIDEDQVNSAIDPTQFGESAIDADDGILFELREGRPYLFPLPDVLPGGLTNEFAIQILSRFNYVNKEKNVNVEQVDHSFDVGETVRITDTGWVSDIADPTGVVVKTDGDSYSVRLFGVKTALELPGDVGDVYFWDPVDRILTTNSTREGVVKLFQKLDSREALLLSQGEGDGGVSKQYVDQQIANAISGGDVDLSSYVTENELTLALSGLGDHFSGDYNDLINTPTIPTVPTDVSAFTNDAGYLTQHQDLSNYALKTDVFSGDYNDLINTPTIPNVSNFLTEAQIDSKISASQFDPTGYATEAYVAQAIANVGSGGDVDLSGYATTVDLNNAIANINTFSGDYNDLTNAPTLTGLATETWVTSQLANYQPTIDLSDYYTKTQVDALIPTTFSGDYNDLTNKPVIPTAFSGDYNDLTNTPTIPSVAGLASVSYVDQQIANVQSGGSIDLSDYVTEAELATQLANYQPTVDLTGYALLTDIPTPFSGNYNDLTNKPSLFDGDYNNLTNKPTLFGGSYNELTDKPNIFSGNYNELYNKPSIPSKTSDLTNDAGFLTNITGQQVQQALGYTPANTTDVFSGDYNSLINKPSIPDVTGLATETYVDDQIAAVVSGGTIDLSGYVTEGELATAIANLGTSNVVNINDLSDVAVGSLPQQANANEHYLLEWNPVNSLWESKDFGNIFATQQYVTETVATIITDGDINLDGYATEQFVEQKIVELGPHFSGDYYDLTNRPMLFSGNYNDLVNIPTRKEYTLTSSGSVLNLVETAADPDQIVASVDFSDLGIGFSGNYEDLFNRPILFSGNYDDLNNKPYIPSIAGLATEEYVDNRWAEPQITGDRYFTHNVEVQGGTTVIKNSTLDSHTAAKRMISLAIQTTDATVTEVRYSDGSAVTFDADTTVMLTATIVAAGDTINDRSAIIHKGILTVDSNNATMVGEAAREIIDEDAYGWTSNIYTDNSGTRELRITVQGSATETVNWTVFLEAYEVQKT